MSDNSAQGAFFTGLVLGGLAGAAAALLMTPKSGSQTRSEIQSTSQNLQSRLQDRGKVIVHDTAPEDSVSTDSGPSETLAPEDSEVSTGEATD